MKSIAANQKNVISLLLKLSLLTCSFIYISVKLSDSYHSGKFQVDLSNKDYFFLIISLFLVIFNWGLEAIKWKFLLSKFESITLSLAIKSILAGVSISIFTPNRIGEFAARVLFINKVDKIKATVISLLGSALQLIVTIILGVSGYFIYLNKSGQDQNSLNFINGKELITVLVILTVAVLFIYFYFKHKLSSHLQTLIVVLRSYTKQEIIIASLLSFFRYTIFSLQFFLILKGLGFNADPIDTFCMITLIFLVTSAIPSFALTEIAVRSATAIYFLGKLSPDPVIITTASILLWIFNLVIPAVIGSFFVVKMDLLSQKKQSY